MNKIIYNSEKGYLCIDETMRTFWSNDKTKAMKHTDEEAKVKVDNLVRWTKLSYQIQNA